MSRPIVVATESPTMPDFAEAVRGWVDARLAEMRRRDEGVLGERLSRLSPHELGRAYVGVDPTDRAPARTAVLVQPVETMTAAQLGDWYPRTLALHRVLTQEGHYG